MKHMRFVLKITLQEFHTLKDPTLYGMIKFIRQKTDNEDIYPEDLKMIRMNEDEKWVVFLIERTPARNVIEVYNDSDIAKLAKA